MPCKGKPKRSEIAIFIQDETDPKPKSINKRQRRDKEDYIMIKGSISQEAITFINTYEHNT